MLRKSLYLLPSLAKKPTMLRKLYLHNSLATQSLSTFSNSSKLPKESHPGKISVEQQREVEEHGETLGQMYVARTLEEKYKHLGEVAKLDKFPPGALFSGLAVTAPLLIGSLSLNLFFMTNQFTDSLPYLFMCLTKYTGFHLAFMSGIHWGFAISEHDLQDDAVNSSPDVRNQFLMASVPLVLSFLLTGNLVYGFAASSLNYKMLNLAGMLGLHLFLFIKESLMFRKQRIPRWYLNMKLGTTMAAIISITAMGVLIYNAEDKLIAKNDPLRKTSLPSDQDILSGNI